MRDRLPFGRMARMSSTPRRLILLITAGFWPSNAWRFLMIGHIIRMIAEMGSLSPLPSRRSIRNG